MNPTSMNIFAAPSFFFFIYFPMSTDLERHLLIYSPYYTNQIEVIRNVAKSIPINYKLYVKENPSNITRDWRDISQYEELLDIPTFLRRQAN